MLSDWGLDMHATNASASSARIAPTKGDGRNRRVVETKRRIMGAAIEIVGNGQELTVVSVSRRAGVSVRSVFQHYRSVEGLNHALRAKILMWLVDNLVCVEIVGATHEVRALNALSHLQSIYLQSPRTVRHLEWTFLGIFDPDSDSAEAEVQFNDKLQSWIGQILGKEVRESFGERHPTRYMQLRLILGAQLNPRGLVPMLDSMGVVPIHHMVIGTINEFMRASKPA